MSMLAGPKRKQKWSLNPRGKDWAEDSNKFGERLLKKMGWSPGKGLGAKEDGMKEHIKVSYKNDSTGIGYKENSDQWLEHTTHFNDLLQSLTSNGQQQSPNNNKCQTDDDDISSCPIPDQPQQQKPLKSLVEKSKKSKKRMHYHKLVRGKDLSRCTEKDLAEIFGRATTAPETKRQSTDDDFRNGDREDTATVQPQAGNSFMFTGGTITDYFKRKLPSWGRKSTTADDFVVGNNGVLQRAPKNDTPSEGEEEETNNYCGFRFVNNTNPSEGSEISSLEEKHCFQQSHNSVGEVLEKKNKKRKLRNEDDVAVDWSGATKKAKKFSSEQELTLEGAVESTFIEAEDKKRNKKNKNKYEELRRETKRSKEKRVKALAIDNPIFLDQSLEADGENSSQTSQIDTNVNSVGDFEVERPKKKKSKTLAIDNPIFLDQSLEEDGENSSQSSQVDTNVNSAGDFEVKRPKKKKSKTLAIDNPIFLDQSLEEDGENSSQTSQIDTNVNVNFEVRRPKRKKSQTLAVDNPVFLAQSLEEDSSELVTSQFEVKRSKKLSKIPRVQAIDNPGFDDSQSLDEEQNEAGVVYSKFEVERSSKKKHKSRDLAVVNPVFLDQSEEEVTSASQTEPERGSPDLDAKNHTPTLDGEEFCDLMLNVVSTPVAPKILVSSSRDSSVKRRKSVRFSQTNQERIIPRITDLEDIEDSDVGNTGTFIGNVERSMSQKIEGLQAELENDLNEAKACKDNNGTRLELKDAPPFLVPPSYMLKENSNSVAKTSYKHLIKGDIVLKFNNSNIDSIQGYGANYSKHFKRNL